MEIAVVEDASDAFVGGEFNAQLGTLGIIESELAQLVLDISDVLRKQLVC